MNNKMQLPIKSFEKYEETLENSNFHPVKILICHTGENLNGSVFSLDSLNKSINTLSNIPILGFVEIMSVAFFPTLSGYKDAFAFLLLIMILLFRPTGLLGEKLEDKI